MLKLNLSSSASNRKLQLARHRRLSTRLTLFIMLVTLPLLVGISFYVATQAGILIEDQANQGLKAATERTEDTLLTWLKMNGQAITELATLPTMSSMDPAQQRPIMTSMADAFPDLFLIHTLNLDGLNVARSDNSAPLDYHDRQWFTQAKTGAPLTYEIVISKTICKPVLAIGAPIKDGSGNIVGVAAGVSKLDEISVSVGTAMVGQTGYVYVIDAKNNLVLHPDQSLTNGTSLVDKSAYPPVVALRNGKDGIVNFTDDQGKTWRSYIIVLANHWAVIAQEPQDELLAPLHEFQFIAVTVAVFGALLMLVLAFLVIRQTLKPIDKLNEAVEAITAGDLARTVEVSSHDEVGVLGTAFNNMTAQLRDLIANLESRVKERTVQLEDANEENTHRTKLLRDIAEITRSVSSIQNTDELLPEITRQISATFGFYHVSIFLTDLSGQYVILQASNSEAGKTMLANNYRVRADANNLVGLVASTGKPRLAEAHGEKEPSFSENNPDLANTRSEMALPLQLGNKNIGVLDLQSTEPCSLTSAEIDTFTLLADQVSVTIQNSRSFDEARQALAKSEGLYQQSAIMGWQQFLKKGNTAYRYVNGSIEALNQPAATDNVDEEIVDGEVGLINLPIIIRGKKLGTISIRQAGRDRAWNENELRTFQSIVDRLSFALENARLYSDAQQRASKERVIGEITTKIRSQNDPNEMIRVAINELKTALNIKDVRIVPYNPPKNGDRHKEE